MRLNQAELLGREAAEGKTRIHIVKHAPKSENQIFNDIVQQQKLVLDNEKKIKRAAKNELKKRKEHLQEREAIVANASETSDIETVN